MDYQLDEDIPLMPEHIKLEPMSGAGFYMAEQWIIYIIENYLDMTELITTKNNYKDMLVSHMHHQLQDVPKFYELNIATRDNAKIFTYCIKDRNNAVIATATGLTKKEAENNSAKEALKHYGIDI